MTKKTIITNSTSVVHFVAGRMLHPGCSMECLEHEVPPQLKTASSSASSKAAPETSGGETSLEDFLQQSLRDMEDNGLADMDMGQLTDLKRLETAAQNRQNVLTALDTAMLQKAKAEV